MSDPAVLARTQQERETEEFLTTTRAFRPLMGRGGDLVFASDLSGHPQVYRLRAPGLWPQLVVKTSERLLPVAQIASGLLARHDRGGNETWQLSLVEGDGRLRTITRDTKAIHQSVTPSPDGRRVGLSYNPNGQVDFVLGVMDLATGAIEDWLREKGVWRWTAFRTDGGQAAVSHVVSPTRVEGFLVEPHRTPLRLLPEARRLMEMTWTAKGALLALSDLGCEYVGLVELDPEHPARPKRWVMQMEADVEGFVPNRAGTRAAVVINQGIYDRLAIIDLHSGAEETVADLPEGVAYSDMTSDVSDHLAWSWDDSSLFVAWETPAQPADIYQLPGATRGLPATSKTSQGGTRWTLAGGNDEPAVITPQLTSYTSFDGLTIPAVFYRIDDRPRPTVVYFHGGPEAQLRGTYLPLVHLLNARGINVFAPNVRGSTGYGIKFFSLDDKALRWNAVRDGCEAARYLKRHHLATRVAALGRSYGGFMTLAVLVEDPELWDAAVEFVGIADWHTFFKNTSGWRRAMRAAEYGDPDGAEAELLRQISPLRQAERIKAPLLVIHGRNDVRVPVSESEQVAKVAANAELMVLEDEGHGIHNHANMVKAYGRAVSFLGDRLFPEGRR